MKIYTHYRNKKKYLIIARPKIRIQSTGDWIPGVLYMCLYWNKEGMLWIRSEEDFKSHFS
jgi:hypothetical protein